MATLFGDMTVLEVHVFALQENGRTQSALENRQWEGPCNERLVAQLLQDLKGWGVDLEAFQPSDLYDTIKGRTLWWEHNPLLRG